MSASLPHPRIPIADQTGRMTPDWYRFLAQFQRDFSGGETVPGSGLTSDGGTLGLADNGVTNAKLRDSLALSVIGRPLNSVGDPQDITANANGKFMQRDNDLLVFRYPRLPSFTVATVPDPVGMAEGTLIYVSNEAGGATVAFSDATNWRRVQDRAIIS